jgi:hypothetical protein
MLLLEDADGVRHRLGDMLPDGVVFMGDAAKDSFQTHGLVPMLFIEYKERDGNGDVDVCVVS